jgi:hypothetical protein
MGDGVMIVQSKGVLGRGSSVLFTGHQAEAISVAAASLSRESVFEG